MGKEALKPRISRAAVAKVAGELVQFAEGQNKPVRLPPERELAEKFGLGRRGIRLAVQLLERKGLVLRKHGSGNYLIPKQYSLSTVYLVIPGEVKTEDPFYSSLIGQLTLYAREHQIQLLPVRLDRTVLLNRQTPGILLAKIGREALEDLAGNLSTLVAMTDLGTDRCCQIFFDDHAIGQEAARQVHRFGHEHALILAGPGHLPSARQRSEGFRSEAARLGMGVTSLEGKMNWRSGYELMAEYLRQTGSRPVSVAFASNDWMAAGALQAMVQAGVRVPEDMSLVGCDDIPLASELVPPLATFRLDTGQFVEQTFIALEQAWRLRLPKNIVLSAEFVLRESLGEKTRNQTTNFTNKDE